MATVNDGAAGSRASPPDARAHDLDALLERWMTRLAAEPLTAGAAGAREAGRIDHGRRSATAAPRERVARGEAAPEAPAMPRASARASGPYVQLEGEAHPFVVSRRGAVYVHRGVIAVRGPLGAQALDGAGLPPPRRAGIEFVAHWFGGAFDAVNVRGSPELSWGFLHLSGDVLARALEAYRVSAPIEFASTLGRHGIEICASPEPDVPTLSLRARTGQVTGPAAAAAIASDARLVAALARAAAEPAARTAQVTAVVAQVLTPALAFPLPAADGPPANLGDRLSTPRETAVLLLAVLDAGARGVRALARAAAAAPGEGALVGYARALEQARCWAAAARIRRTLSSPELAPAYARA